MKRLFTLWKTVTASRREPVLAIRMLAILSFAAVLAVFVGRMVHLASLADFCGGLALSFSGVLVFLVFSLHSVQYKDDSHENQLTELHLSR